MSKHWARLWGLVLITGLVACRSAASPTLTPTSTSEVAAPTSTPVAAAPTPTRAAGAKTTTPAAQPTAEEKAEPTATNAVEDAGEEDTEPPWQIPEVGEEDWTKGASGAGLVVVEYSDFQ